MKIQWSFSLFLLFDWKYPFWANLVQKIKIVSIAVIWYLDEFEHGEFNGDALFFLVSAGNTLFGRIWSKKSKLLI